MHARCVSILRVFVHFKRRRIIPTERICDGYAQREYSKTYTLNFAVSLDARLVFFTEEKTEEILHSEWYYANKR